MYNHLCMNCFFETRGRAVKKCVSLLLCFLLMLTFAGCNREEKLAEEIISCVAAEYDAFLDDFEYERDLYTVKSVSYEINEVVSTVTDTYFCVDVTWYVEVDDRNEIIRNILLSELSGALPYCTWIDGEQIGLSHTKESHNDSVRIVFNSGGAYSGNDYYKDTVGDKDEDGNYSEVKCPGCGSYYRSSSTYGRMAEKYGYCGVGGCGK